MKKGYRKKLLKYEIFMLFVLVAVVLDMAIVGISYAMYTKNINAESEKICTGLSEAIASSLNGNRIDDWLNGERMSDYRETESQLVNILNSYSDIINIRALKMNLDGPRVVFDFSRTRTEREPVGTTLEYGQALGAIKNRLISGEYSGTTVSEVGKETVITSITPVTDVANNVTCYAICEIGMKTMKNNRSELIKTLFYAILIVSVILVLFLTVYINYSVVKPITKIDYELRKMTGCNKAEDVIEELQLIKKCRISEVSSICDGFIDILGDISQRDMEAESFEEEAKERMLRAINKSDSAEELPPKKKARVAIPRAEKSNSTGKKTVKVVLKKVKKTE